MSLVTIELREAINGVRVSDEHGIDTPFDLVKGINEVPAHVADHWYVRRFIVPPAAIPPVNVPASARMPLPAAPIQHEAAAPAVEEAQAVVADPAPEPDAAPRKAK